MAPLSEAAALLRCHCLTSLTAPVLSHASRGPVLSLGRQLESEAILLVTQASAGKPMPLKGRLCVSPPESSSISFWRADWHLAQKEMYKDSCGSEDPDRRRISGREELFSSRSTWGGCCFPTSEHSGQHKACGGRHQSLYGPSVQAH